MTKQELNRDTKRLATKIIKLQAQKDSEKYFSELPAIEKEFKRIYYADQNFEYLNRANILRMFRINLKLRVIAFHQFGLMVELEKIK